MKQLCALWLIALCCSAASAEEPKKSDDEEYLKYTIPKGAKSFEANPRPGSEYAISVGYYVGDVCVGTRKYWDREKTKLYSEELFKGWEEVKGLDLKTSKRHGVQRAWHKNGQLKSEAPYKDGEMHGTFRQWDEKGKLLGSFTMKEGTGTFQEWYPNGQVDRIEPRKGGKVDGECRTYFDTGKLFQVITFKDGEANGVSYVWDRDGKLEQGYPRFYLRGKNVTKEEYLKAKAADPSLPSIRSPECVRD